MISKEKAAEYERKRRRTSANYRIYITERMRKMKKSTKDIERLKKWRERTKASLRYRERINKWALENKELISWRNSIRYYLTKEYKRELDGNKNCGSAFILHGDCDNFYGALLMAKNIAQSDNK